MWGQIYGIVSSKWLALLSTDLSLPDKDVVRVYGKRCDIEVFFKMAKHYLKLDSEVQVRDFDSITHPLS